MPESRILLGVIGRPHGVRGLVHVTSHTADPADLTAYGPLSDDRGRRFTLRWVSEGVAEVAELADGVPTKLADRAAAEKLKNVRLYVERQALPAPEADEFYLADLVGLAAFDTAGAALGAVTAVHDYGAGASLEIARAEVPPLLVPFTRAAVPEVDLSGGRIAVDENLARSAGEVEVRSTEGEGPAGREPAHSPSTRQTPPPRGTQPAAPHPRRFAPRLLPQSGEV